MSDTRQYGPWGEVAPGDCVTTFGRHGAGQPELKGVVRSVVQGQVVIETENGRRLRSLRNVRRIMAAGATIAALLLAGGCGSSNDTSAKCAKLRAEAHHWATSYVADLFLSHSAQVTQSELLYRTRLTADATQAGISCGF